MKRIIAALATFGFLASQAAAQDKAPIEDFFKLSQYAWMVLSPDGKHIAALAPVSGRQNIVVIDVEKRKATPITNQGTKDVTTVRWVNNKRLIFETGLLDERAFNQRGGALYAVDLDGTAVRLLREGSDERTSSGARVTYRGLGVVRILPGDTDDLIMQEVVFSGGERSTGPLYRVDTRTGRKTDISLGKPDVAANEGWAADRTGVARVFTAADKGTVRIYYRAGPDAAWQKLDEFPQEAVGWRPVAIADDNRSLWVSSRKGRDKAAIMRYDPETKSFGEVIAEHPQVDLDNLSTDKEGVRGVRFEADRGGSAWFVEDLASVQGIADRAFPDNVNLLSWSRDRDLVLITSYSDVLPGSFYLFHRKTNKIEWLADVRPWIDPKKMSPMQPVRYKARDGLEIPAYLTTPRGSTGKSLPMVVVVHGGPWVDGDRWGWDPEVQFLASRGYAVLQPNFRGTGRYGWKHYSSSFKQWGLTMQDDVTDGVKWAIEQGVADPNRICIYGGSYGGYATMMGLAKTPELFKCGINYVGVTDLPLMLTATWSDMGQEYLSYGAKRLVGDVDRDMEQLRNTSPVNLAAQIKAPVLMAYGSEDHRVPIEHGTRMRSALERAGRPPQWIVGEGEGHGFRKMENKVLFYGAMEKFLDQHIGAQK